MAISSEAALAVYRRSDCLYNKAELNVALDKLALEISSVIADQNPLVLTLMTGGLIPASELLLRMDFPLELDYIHATRYGNQTSGNQLEWIAHPRKPLKDRVILIIDDILDEGQTLAAILQYCQDKGAKAVYSAVLVEKLHDRKSGIDHADFTGLTVPDRYVFGYGMDYKGYLRNVPGIFAAQKDDE